MSRSVTGRASLTHDLDRACVSTFANPGLTPCPEVVDSALPHLAISVFGAPQMMHNLYIYGSFGHVILRVDSPVLIFELYSFIRLKIHYQHNRHHRLKWEWLQ